MLIEKKKLSNLQIYVLNSRLVFLHYKLYGNMVKYLRSFLYFLSNFEECVSECESYSNLAPNILALGFNC